MALLGATGESLGLAGFLKLDPVQNFTEKHTSSCTSNNIYVCKGHKNGFDKCLSNMSDTLLLLISGGINIHFIVSGLVHLSSGNSEFWI